MAHSENLVTLVAIALVSYICADVTHHVLGHGAACLMMGGRIELLSSIVVRCSLTGSLIDLAGPAANLAVGLAALLAGRAARRRSSATRLGLNLIAAFNLLWFGMQLAFSVATGTDDWAWAVRSAHQGEALRYGLILAGIVIYGLTVRVIGAEMVPFATPSRRIRIIAVAAWLSAGLIACLAALFDHETAASALRIAVPQSLMLSAGILYLPIRAGRIAPSQPSAASLGLSVGWIAAAVVLCILSLWFLGPGISLG